MFPLEKSFLLKKTSMWCIRIQQYARWETHFLTPLHWFPWQQPRNMSRAQPGWQQYPRLIIHTVWFSQGCFLKRLPCQIAESLPTIITLMEAYMQKAVCHFTVAQANLEKETKTEPEILWNTLAVSPACTHLRLQLYLLQFLDLSLKPTSARQCLPLLPII